MIILSPFTTPNRNAFCALLIGSAFTVSSAFGAPTIVRVPADQASLQVALDTVPDGGIIEIAAGTYNAPSGGFTIYPDLSGGTRSFTGRAARGAAGAFKSRVFIRDNTFTGNRTNLAGHASFSAGGAIHGNSSTMFINNSRFENNQAGYVGGAIYVIGPYTDSLMDLVVSDCLFTGNVA